MKHALSKSTPSAGVSQVGIPRWVLSVGCLLAFSARATACAVCMGSDNPQTVQASNTVLWSLLGLVGFIFTATGLTVLYIWLHARR